MKRLIITVITLLVSLVALVTFLVTVTGQDQTFVVYTGLTWAPDGKHLAFTKVDLTRPSGKGDIVTSDILVVNTNGTGQKRFGSEGVAEMSPSFSRDGKSLLFGVRDEKQSIYDLYSANIDGSGVKRLPTNLKHAVSPQISPDGEKIVFTANLSDESGDHYSQIFVMKNGGGELKNLTKTDHLAFHEPLWSPDGKSIVYYATRSEMSRVWIMNSDGQNKRPLTDEGVDSGLPSWSADGKRILFTVSAYDKGMLYSIKPDGTDRRSLSVEANMGRWSPNGEKLAYIRGRTPDIAIYVANADGSRPKKILP